MIRLHRPLVAPAVLLTDGCRRREEHEKAYVEAPATFETRTSKFEFDREVYAHPSVKAALCTMQNEKCAFCEAKPLHVSDGDVEHFRPKAEVRQAKSGPIERPGYFWLAYEWDNLLFACERCNRREKKSAFPLVDASRRAWTPQHNLGAEQPLFVNPAAEDPAPHIGYREHVPFAVGGSARGEATIESLGLRRPSLSRDREEHLERLRCVYLVAEVLTGVPAETAKGKATLARALGPDAEYSLMAQAAVTSWTAGSLTKASP